LSELGLAVRAVKMSGAGNDFLVLEPEARRALGDRFVPWIRAVCRRGVSVGADGVLVVSPAGADRVEVEFRNPDGSVAFCGNGTRCAARFASRRGWIGSSGTCVTAAGDVAAVLRDDRVALRLPPPQDRGPLRVETARGIHEGRWIVAGVSHFVVRSDDVDSYPLAEVGPLLRAHRAFGPDGTNVDVVAWDGAGGGTVRIRTWERGVEGETLACGSGAVAAAAALRRSGAPPILEVVPMSGIPLSVGVPDPPGSPPHVDLEGDARFLMEGTVGSEAFRIAAT
jgi:diaminopimelate epimerase